MLILIVKGQLQWLYTCRCGIHKLRLRFCPSDLGALVRVKGPLSEEVGVLDCPSRQDMLM